MSRGIKNILLAAAAFSSGVITGFLLTPKSGKENRQWVSIQSKETKGWIEGKGQKLVEESEKRMDRFSEGVRKTVRNSLPDLYKATEGMNFLNDKRDEPTDD